MPEKGNHARAYTIGKLEANYWRSNQHYGGAEGIRTPDLLLANYAIGLLSTNLEAKLLFLAHPCFSFKAPVFTLPCNSVGANLAPTSPHTIPPSPQYSDTKLFAAHFLVAA